MKALNPDLIDAVEAFAELKGSWIIIENKYGKNKLTERVSFYQYKDRRYCIIDRTGDHAESLIYQYDNRDEGNRHFNEMKLKVTLLKGYFLYDKRSG